MLFHVVVGNHRADDANRLPMLTQKPIVRVLRNLISGDARPDRLESSMPGLGQCRNRHSRTSNHH